MILRNCSQFSVEADDVLRRIGNLDRGPKSLLGCIDDSRAQGDSFCGSGDMAVEQNCRRQLERVQNASEAAEKLLRAVKDWSGPTMRSIEQCEEVLRDLIRIESRKAVMVGTDGTGTCYGPAEYEHEIVTEDADGCCRLVIEGDPIPTGGTLDEVDRGKRRVDLSEHPGIAHRR